MGRKNKQTKNLKQYNNDSTKNRDSKVVNFNQVLEFTIRLIYCGICDKVLKRLKNILYEDTEKPVKFIKIQEMKQFFLTQPFLKLGRAKEKKKLKYSNDKQALICLDKVIILCNEIASTFTRRHSSCFNEAFHALTAKYLSKKFNLGNTCDVRLYASILHYNVGDDWLELIYDQLKLPKTYIERLKRFCSDSRKI